MKFSFSLLLVFITLSSAVAQVVRQQFGSRRTNTLTTFVTSTASTASTTVMTTRSVCASLISPVATTPCRRKRQFWNVPLYFALGHQDDAFQFQPVNPSQVLRVEPSVLPEYRYRPSSFARPFASQEPLNSPLGLQPSFDRMQPVSFRVADPFFGAVKFSALSAIYANILNNILTPAITVTRTTTVFPATITNTLYTEIVTLTLDQAACVPAGLTICPAAPTTTSAPSTTTSPATTTSSATTTPTATTTSPATTTPSANTTTAPATSPVKRHHLFK
ncbi:hypothetical protein GHT06_015882 [Daphnia sinensis]|uniref:Uncharacterized protein n=1 Tax=Daphnia sinensis TaxID=1820382 RepID=A0AAD5PV28_9CRUS|nr:hypothetical protein GHT06_015882 [Daphnia sinensis]